MLHDFSLAAHSRFHGESTFVVEWREAKGSVALLGGFAALAGRG
jgi:hypothetical protein